MAISDKNTRVLVTMPKDLKDKLEKKAKDENRTVNNLILTILLREADK